MKAVVERLMAILRRLTCTVVVVLVALLLALKAFWAAVVVAQDMEERGAYRLMLVPGVLVSLLALAVSQEQHLAAAAVVLIPEPHLALVALVSVSSQSSRLKGFHHHDNYSSNQQRQCV